MALIAQISSSENLRAAVQGVRKKYPLLRDRAWFDERLDEKIQHLQRALSSGKYQSSKVTFYYSMLDKPLCCAHLDCQAWVAHEAILQPLARFFAGQALKYCTYRANQSDEILAQCRLWKTEHGWVAGTDIRRFFDSVQHGLLLESLEKILPCPTTLRLIENMLRSFDHASLEFETLEPGRPHRAGMGLPAGIELVYLLTSVMLGDIDRKIHALSGGAYARYIDDFLVFGASPDHLRDWVAQLEAGLSLLGLNLHADKTFLRQTSEPFFFLRQAV